MYPGDDRLLEFCTLGKKEEKISLEEVRRLIELARHVFRSSLTHAGKSGENIKQVLTKFVDAGRRSPPTSTFSQILPGRPQSGADGNRTLRWLLDAAHKFYSEEIPATLVEVKYILQTLSMNGAPEFPSGTIQKPFVWLVGHEVIPGTYLDPVQQVPIELTEFLSNRRLLHSGHIFPLDRGGRHRPANAFLILARSNQLQGNNTVPELVDLMRNIVKKHDEGHDYFAQMYKNAMSK